MGKVIVDCVLTTTQRVEAYGGVQLGREVLEDLAKAVLERRMPMTLDHDARRQLDVEVVATGVRTNPKGYEEAWATLRLDESVWNATRERWDSLGAPGGMSFSLSTPLARIDPASHPTISISADAHHFAAPSLVQIAHELSTQYGQFAAVEPNHYFQFGAEPLPIVVMEYSAALVAAAPPQMFSALLYDIIKSSLRIRRTKRGEPTVFEGFERVEPDGTRELSWYLRTDSEEVALKAVESLPMSSRRLEFKATHTWEPISGDRDLPT